MSAARKAASKAASKAVREPAPPSSSASPLTVSQPGRGGDSGGSGGGDSNGGASNAGASKAGTGRWVFAARLSVQAAQLLIFLAAARFLAPAEFGVFALVQAFSALLFLFAAAGWKEFIMSWRGDARGLDQAITYAIVGGLAMCAAGAAAAGGLALVFEDRTPALLLLLFSGCVLLSPVAAAFSGVLVRVQRVPAMALATIAAEIVGLVVAIACLFAGWGVFALALGKIAVQLITVAGVVGAARWRYRPLWRGGAGREILSVSGQILANRVVGYMQTNGATFIIGAFLGPASVGFYRAAERLVAAVAELVMEPLRTIAWVELGRATPDVEGANGANGAKSAPDADDAAARAALSARANELAPLFLVLAAPVFLGLAVVARDIVIVLLGEKWAPSSPIATVFALAALGAAPHAMTEPILSLSGQIRRLPPVLLVNALVAMGLMATLASRGLEGAVLAVPLSATFSVVMITRLQARAVGVRWPAVVRRAAPALLACVLMAGAVAALRAALDSFAVDGAVWTSPLLSLALQVGVGAAVYLAVLTLARARLLRAALSLI